MHDADRSFAAIAIIGGHRRRAGAEFPTKPITMVVPFPAGGAADTIVRTLGERMRASLGQPS